jgi:hypothetical protein
MNGIYWVLLGTALIGLLPLVIIIYKKRRADRILREGLSAQASVYQVYTSIRRSAEIVHYRFTDLSRNEYVGRLMTELGKYRIGDFIEIYYLQDNPKRNTVRGSWGSKFIIGFGIVIALVVWFMVYKLYEMVKGGQF